MSRVRPGGLALTRRVDSEHDISRSQLRARGGSRGAGLHSGAVTGASRGPQHTGAWGRAGCGQRGLGGGQSRLGSHWKEGAEGAVTAPPEARMAVLHEDV